MWKCLKICDSRKGNFLTGDPALNSMFKQLTPERRSAVKRATVRRFVAVFPELRMSHASSGNSNLLIPNHQRLRSYSGPKNVSVVGVMSLSALSAGIFGVKKKKENMLTAGVPPSKRFLLVRKASFSTLCFTSSVQQYQGYVFIMRTAMRREVTVYSSYIVHCSEV